MNFSIHIDEPLAKALARAVKRAGKTRNALINEALRAWLEQQARTEWPAELLEAEPFDDLVPFEQGRTRKPTEPRFP